MDPVAWIQNLVVLAGVILVAAGTMAEADIFNFTITGPSFSGMGKISGYLEAPYPTGDPGLYRVTGLNATFTYFQDSFSVNRGFGEFIVLPNMNEYFFADVVGENKTGFEIGISSYYSAPNRGEYFLTTDDEGDGGGGGFDDLRITPVSFGVPAPVAGSGLVPFVAICGVALMRRKRRRRSEVN